MLFPRVVGASGAGTRDLRGCACTAAFACPRELCCSEPLDRVHRLPWPPAVSALDECRALRPQPFDELRTLLDKLGYDVTRSNDGGDGERFRISHPESRRLVFLGDLVDRGPRIVECLRLAMDAVAGGVALCVPGNHEIKLLKHLRGRDVKRSHGLAETIEQLEAEPPELRDRVARFIGGLVSHPPPQPLP